MGLCTDCLKRVSIFTETFGLRDLDGSYVNSLFLRNVGVQYRRVIIERPAAFSFTTRRLIEARNQG